MSCKTVSEAGTFMVAAAVVGSDLLIEDTIWEHNRPLLSKDAKWIEVTEEDRKKFASAQMFQS